MIWGDLLYNVPHVWGTGVAENLINLIRDSALISQQDTLTHHASYPYFTIVVIEVSDLFWWIQVREGILVAGCTNGKSGYYFKENLRYFWDCEVEPWLRFLPRFCHKASANANQMPAGRCFLAASTIHVINASESQKSGILAWWGGKSYRANSGLKLPFYWPSKPYCTFSLPEIPLSLFQ